MISIPFESFPRSTWRLQEWISENLLLSRAPTSVTKGLIVPFVAERPLFCSNPRLAYPSFIVGDLLYLSSYVLSAPGTTGGPYSNHFCAYPQAS